MYVTYLNLVLTFSKLIRTILYFYRLYSNLQRYCAYHIKVFKITLGLYFDYQITRHIISNNSILTKSTSQPLSGCKQHL